MFLLQNKKDNNYYSICEENTQGKVESLFKFFS